MATVKWNLCLTQLYIKHWVELHRTEGFYVHWRLRRSVNIRSLVSAWLTQCLFQFLSIINIERHLFDICAFYTWGKIFFCMLDEKSFLLFLNWLPDIFKRGWEIFGWILRAEIKSLPFLGFVLSCFGFFFPKWDFQNSLSSRHASPVAEGKCCKHSPSAPRPCIDHSQLTNGGSLKPSVGWSH